MQTNEMLRLAKNQDRGKEKLVERHYVAIGRDFTTQEYGEQGKRISF